jgi:hypothetical protein
MERGGYDRTLYITEDTEQIPCDKNQEFPKHFEKSDISTKL